MNARLGGFRSFLTGKVFDTLKYRDSVDSLAEMLMKFLSFHTASVKGSRVPVQYRTSHYVVTDWRGHGLRQPPRGYHWMQYGGDYLLWPSARG